MKTNLQKCLELVRDARDMDCVFPEASWDVKAVTRLAEGRGLTVRQTVVGELNGNGPMWAMSQVRIFTFIDVGNIYAIFGESGEAEIFAEDNVPDNPQAQAAKDLADAFIRFRLVQALGTDSNP